MARQDGYAGVLDRQGGQSAGECLFHQGTVVLDQAGQEPKVDDSPVACWGEVDHLAYRRGIFTVFAAHDPGGFPA